jgi:diacylglycerol kinase family enzyme
MYLYIYDSFLSHQKFNTLLSNIEQRVNNLGITGKIARLTILKNMQELISDAVKAGVTTIVAVGDDQTFAKIINAIAPLKVTLGLIPSDGSSKIARVLGVPPKEAACDVVAARIVKQIDLANINGYYFINSAIISNAKVQITCDGYSLAPLTELNTVRICNAGCDGASATSNPMDGKLEAIITPIQSGWLAKKEIQSTVLPFTKIRIQSAGEDVVSIVTDEQVVLKTPASVEVAPGRLRVIVGVNRVFE